MMMHSGFTIALMAVLIGGCSSSTIDDNSGSGAETLEPLTESQDSSLENSEPPTEQTPEPEVTRDPPHFSYCKSYTAQNLEANGGQLIDNLQANWQVVNDQQGGAHLVLTSSPRGTFTSFDAASGDVVYMPDASRVPDRVKYDLRDDAGVVLETYEHVWVSQPLRIMPLGDSITSGIDFFDGVEYPSVPLRVGYRKTLYERLLANGHVIDFIGQAGQRAGQAAGLADPDNNGYPGVDIAFINSKITQVLDEGPSDVLLLHIGTNKTPATANGLMQVLDTIDAWAVNNFPVHVLVATLIPKRDPELQLVVDAFNADLRNRLAARSQRHVVLVEQALALSNADLSSEAVGVHPNPGGYAKMANVWYEALESAGLIQDCRTEVGFSDLQ